MTVHNFAVERVGDDIRKGLTRIAKAIEAVAERPTYNIIVNTNGTDPEVVAQNVTDALNRIQERERSID